MAKLTRLTADQRENLTAYLDEELEEEQAVEIERALAESPVVRHEVDMLSRTWDLLDVLPNARATEGFSRRTLSSIRAADESQPDMRFDKVARSGRRALMLALWTAALGAFAYVGFEATHRWAPQEHEKLLENYEVIAKFDELSAVGSLDFVKILEDRRTFADYHDPNDN